MLSRDDFLGQWSLERTITDHLSGLDGVLSGQVVFSQAGPTRLFYHENGTLRVAGGPELTAQRRYIWDFAAGDVAVFFDDGRPFHSFVPKGHAAGTDHPCGDDYYTVRYDFTAWPAWRATWTVTGPAKDYVLVSRYTPPR